jgi:Lrp/AsnC family transcriptional regulator
MSIALDELDIRLLQELQRDATIPLVDLADKVASSKSVCWRRIQRFLDEGIITERIAVIDPKKVGLGVMVIAMVKVDRRQGNDSVEQFLSAIRNFPEIIECHALMGDIDLMLKIVVKDVDAYEEFLWQKIQKLQGIQEIRSSISLTRFVDTRSLPLRPTS